MGHRSKILLLLFVAAKLLLHLFIVNDAYDLHRDEYLHLDQGNHLAAGYLSVPPFTAFVSFVIHVLGGGVFWVRFFPALFGTLTMLLIWKTISLLKGGWYAQTVAATAFLFSAVSRVNILYQPNSADILAWTLLLYLLIAYVNNRKSPLLLWLGLVAGLAFLNKYNVLFVIAGVVPALLLARQWRIFAEKYLYVGIMIALIVAAPNIIWQLRQGMPVLHHMKELADTQLVNVDRMGFVVEQLLFFMFGTCIWVTGLISLFWYKPFCAYRFFGWSFLLVMALFIYLKAKGYYALGLYPVMLAYGSVYWERLFSNGWLRYTRPVWLVLIALPMVMLYRFVFPVLPPEQLHSMIKPGMRELLCRWEDGQLHDLPQDFADMRGWRELAGLVANTFRQAPLDERRHLLILCENYGQAGAINFYAKKEVTPAVTFNADYMNWFPATDSLRYVIVVGDELQEYVRQYASGHIKTGQVTDVLAREYRTGVYLLTGISPVFADKLRQWQLEKQQAFRAWK
ncbi:ArnT family glycosyltransferase [Chitinophaga rhizophila]|uniref:Glycosyltransferase family 39 protein n=1 Tax=Chitinophaga rhizophila TaxID=2866212 RepID=A0ABS7GFB6_9BACT|nr:glycosyltransferase family 39 protein [Chitinophaga rhizophila]MBW8685835.1 glycosyltransferase family 39 protein [Chitinophaga rhizophila]